MTITVKDFTINAIARDIAGDLIDPFNGIEDLRVGVLRCPINASTSFENDPLRILRALRFSITKDMELSRDIINGIKNVSPKRFIETVSIERVREELEKMFKYDTSKTLTALIELKSMNFLIFKHITENLWFKPTTELK